MEPARPPRRWLLGWLFVLELALVAGFWSRVAWLWLYWAEFYHNGHYYWLAPMLWLAVAGLGVIGIVLTISNLAIKSWKRALLWLLLAGLAAGHCLVGFLPLLVSMGAGTTLEVPKEE